LRPQFFNTPTALNAFKRRLVRLREADKLVWSTLPDGTIEYHTPHYLAYFDLPANVLEAQGKEGWTVIVHPDDLPVLRKKWETARNTGTLYEARARMRCYDGEYRWFLNRATPVRDEKGNVIRWSGTTTPQ
jgi:PAS domain S-box-containing protein